jgi:hypothetical protein
MQDEFLRIATHIPHPRAVAEASLAFAAVVLALSLRAKKWLLGVVMALAIVAVGLVPLVALSYAKSQNIYRVRLVVIRPDQSSADIAQVRSSIGGELNMVDGGWQLDIPPQMRPPDGNVTFFADVKDEFLLGKSTLLLADDFYPTATVQLAAVTSAMLRGVVVDEDLRAVAGATVSVKGYPNTVVTDRLGKFALPAHAGMGQKIEVSAKKGRSIGRISTPAGKTVEIIISPE